MDILMQITRTEYLSLKRNVKELTSENEALKKEIKTLKSAVEKADTKKKGDKE